MADPQKAALAAAWAVQQAGEDWNGFCQLFVEQAYNTRSQYPSAAAAIGGLKPRRSLEDAQPGDVVLFIGDSTNNFQGHAGIYLGNGRMRSATPKGVQETGILDDPYYGPRFAGIAKAPAEWVGQANTPALAKGAEKLLAAVRGGTSVTDTTQNPQRREYQNQLPAAHAAAADAGIVLAQARAALTKVNPQSTEPYKAAQDAVADAQKALDGAKKAVNDLYAKVAEIDTKALTGATDKAQMFKGDDGRQWEVVTAPDGTNTARPISGQGEPAAPARRIQIAGQYIVDLDQGRVIGQLPEQPEAPGAAEQREVNLATARMALERARLQLQQEVSPEAQRMRQLAVEQAEVTLQRAIAAAERETDQTAESLRAIDLATKELNLRTGEAALQRAQRPQLVDAPANRRNLVTQDAEGNFTLNANPAFEEPAPAAIADPAAQYQQQAIFLQQQARQERDRLLGLQREGVITAEEAGSRFDQYWVTRVQAPLEGLRIAASNERDKQQRVQEEAQRKENIRVEDINRGRQQYGYERGELDRTAAAKIIPTLRSPDFIANQLAQINRWGKGDFSGVQWTPEMMQLQPQQVPSLDAISSQGAARALAHISPAAAQHLNRPLPDVAALPQIPQMT